MTLYKLHYFNAQGAAEFSRLIFAEAGVKFEDIRYSFEEWYKKKTDKSVFIWSQMPVLEVDGKPLPQSITIARYLANQFGLAGESAWDKAIIDSYIDVLTDIQIGMHKLHFEKDETKKEIAQGEFKEMAPKKLDVFEEILKGKTYFVGEKVSFADIRFMQTFASIEKFWPECLEKYPNCKAHCERVANRENIKKWIATRLQTPF